MNCPDNSCQYNFHLDCMADPNFEWLKPQEFECECEFGHRAFTVEDIPAMICKSRVERK
jgi:hypothetical protein